MADATKGVEAKVPASEKPQKAPKEQRQSVFKTADDASKEAAGRTKGPRRAFKCTYGGKDYFVVANNEGRAGGLAFGLIGGAVEEIGGRVRKSKPIGVDAIEAVLATMSDEDKKRIRAALDAAKK